MNRTRSLTRQLLHTIVIVAAGLTMTMGTAGAAGAQVIGQHLGLDQRIQRHKLEHVASG